MGRVKTDLYKVAVGQRVVESVLDGENKDWLIQGRTMTEIRVGPIGGINDSLIGRASTDSTVALYRQRVESELDCENNQPHHVVLG